MNKYLIREADTLPEAFPVEFSKKVRLEIESIKELNKDNKEALSIWYDALNTYLDLLSQRAVAWNYANQQFTLPNGTLCMYADGFYIGYTVKTNFYGAYVYVFMIKYQLKRYGLKRPEGITENISSRQIIETNIHQLIKESLRTALMEHLRKERKRRNHRHYLCS